MLLCSIKFLTNKITWRKFQVMGNVQPIRKEENEPTNIGDRAFDNLKFIRETMERSAIFTSVPGYGGVLMGATAIVAAIIANGQIYLRNWLIVWLIEAILAFLIGLLAMWQKSKLLKTPLVSAPSKKFAKSFLPPFFCGIVITLGLWRFELYEAMVAVWLLSYGAAVVCGGAFSVKVVPIMGWCFMVMGAIAFLLPRGFGDEMMAASFGVLHVVFGFIIGRKFGG